MGPGAGLSGQGRAGQGGDFSTRPGRESLDPAGFAARFQQVQSTTHVFCFLLLFLVSVCLFVFVAVSFLLLTFRTLTSLFHSKGEMKQNTNAQETQNYSQHIFHFLLVCAGSSFFPGRPKTGFGIKCNCVSSMR